MIGLAWRLLGRELRSGELRLLLAALVVAVAAVSAVGFFADRVRLALDNQAQQLLGGDLILIADHPWPAGIVEEAGRRGLQVAETLTFPSMVQAAGQVQLADIKAVSSNYPLRGSLGVTRTRGASAAVVNAGPPAGMVWLDERLADALQVAPGAMLTLGNSRLRVDAILVQEPDRSFNLFSLAPRLMMNVADIPASGLVQFGSRVTYRVLLAGEARVLSGFRNWLDGRLASGERLEDAQNARPEIRSALERAQRFLGLATLLTVVLAAVAVALAARRYMQRHLDACAMMRCLGMTQRRLIGLHAWLFAWLAVLAIGLGGLLGFFGHFVLSEWLAALLATRLPLPGAWPLLHGAAVVLVLLFGFALPPVLQLSRVPTLRVLRRELGPPTPWLLGGYGLGLLLLAGLMLLVADDRRLGGIAVIGFAGALGVFWLCARLAIFAIAGVRRGGAFGWRQGMANLSRHAASSSLQIVALAIGLMAMLLLTVTRGELLAAWQKASPLDAPNRFVINIQPGQRAEVAASLAAAGIKAELSPMIRARLQKIAGRPVSAASFPEDERAQRLIEREFNLSWRTDLPAANQIVAGRWFAPPATGQAEASVEEGLAKTLGIKLGDELLFMIAGQEKSLRVSSLRKLDWDSMRVNFFVLTPPGVIEDAPASYITSFYQPETDTGFGRQLVAQFPNLTVIDVAAVLRQLQDLVGQVAGAVQFIFLFTLAAGAIVLYAALLSAFDERRYELAVMRALGARRPQLRQAMLAELAVIGGLAGLLAAAGAMALGQLIAWRVFALELPLTVWLPLASLLGGALLAIAIGWLAIRSLLDTPPLQALRAGA